MAAFDVGRVFTHEWTVNWRFLSEKTFVDARLHVALLGLHLVVLVAFAFTKWLPRHGGLYRALTERARRPVSPGGLVTVPCCQLAEIVYAMFTANLIGMVFARSLHYQFYVWYYYSLPFLFHRTSLRAPVK